MLRRQEKAPAACIICTLFTFALFSCESVLQEISAHIAGLAVDFHLGPVIAHLQHGHLGAHGVHADDLGLHAGIQAEIDHAAAIDVLEGRGEGLDGLSVGYIVGAQEFAAHVAFLAVHGYIVPAVAALEHLDLRAGLKGGDDIALRAGRVAQVQTDAGIGAHIQRAVAGAAGQILGHHVAGLAVHSYAAPGIALLMDGHPRAGGILAQHLGIQ